MANGNRVVKVLQEYGPDAAAQFNICFSISALSINFLREELCTNFYFN